MCLRDGVPALGAIAVSLCFLTSAIAGPTYVRVDVVPPPLASTYLLSVNNKGEAVGYFALSGKDNGFIYKPDGTIADVKTHSGKPAYLFDINNSGVTLGNKEVDTKQFFEIRGIVGNTHGKAKDFVVLDGKFDTEPQSINDGGDIAGFYLDKKNLVYHGFIRTADGSATGFDAPGAGTDSDKHQGTFALAINATDASAGYFSDASNVSHGFVRDPSGTLTIVDPDPGHGATCDAINDSGTVAGAFGDGTSTHGFVRLADGTMKSFDALAGARATVANNINKSGVIAGYVVDSAGVPHGFVRAHDGTITVFDVPDLGGGAAKSTRAFGINDKGEIVGYYTDTSSTIHGFLRLP